MPQEPPSPSTSSVLLPFLGNRSRRGSLASISSRRDIDKDVLSQALDTIHISASKSDALTSFHDFDGGVSRAGPNTKDIVSNGVSSLFNRFKSSVGGNSPAREARARPDSRAGKDNTRQDTLQSDRLSKPVPAALRNVDSELYSTSTRQSPVTSTFSSSTLIRPQITKDIQSKRVPGIDVRDHARPGSADTFPDNHSSQSDDDTHDDSSVMLERSELAAHALAQAVTGNFDRHSTHAKASETSSRSSSDFTIQQKPSSLDSPMKQEAKSAMKSPLALSFDGQKNAARPAMVHVGVSHLPGFQPSEVSSPVNELPSPGLPLLGAEKVLEPSPNLNSAMQRRRTGLKQHQPMQTANGLPTHLKRRVISKEFWMKDENAKVCFDCGQAFSTFRRKHHCRTCGQIFDAKCTSLVSARPFGQPGTLRLCKPCEDMIFGSNDDDSSVYTDDGEEDTKSPDHRKSLTSEEPYPPVLTEQDRLQHTGLATPSIGIPASRRNREAKRRSAVIEFDAQPTLIRPTSSRSLVALSHRPRSSSHKRHQSRASIRTSKSPEESIPFSQDDNGATPTNELPVFHNDNVIDPDLAPYLSDEESEYDEQPDIFTTMSSGAQSSPVERDRLTFGTLLSSTGRKGRPTTADRNAASSVRGAKDDDAASVTSRHYPRLSRRGTPSIGSMNAIRPSPRRSKSNNELDAHGQPKIIRSCAMRDCDARPLELNRASFEHVQKLLAQLLADARIQQAHAWEKALLPILLRCTDDVDPDVPRGDDMDIRHYIKLKKVPGGRPGDTSYVSGVVFSKNVALKSMARSIRNPRIAIVTFAIEYARHQAHFMSLEPVIAQEREYLQNLVSRIAALRPQLLLVQRNVSGLALNMLAKAGITVAYNIKESVLAAVARVTQTTMIKSVDKLTIDPHHLGHCEGFDVKTYVHEQSRKSYIVLSGCQPDLGCTVVLRGADTATLRKMKRVTEFMCYVVYNLKLETYLMRDEFVSIPVNRTGQLSSDTRTSSTEDNPVNPADPSQDISELARTERTAQSRILSASPFIVFMQPYLLTQLLDSEKKLSEYKLLRDTYTAADEEPENEKLETEFKLVEPEMVRVPPSKDQPKAVKDYLHAVYDAQYTRTLATFENQKKLWQAFLANDAKPFDPFSHQTIVVLHSTVSSITSAPCVGPELLGIGFYAGYNRAEADFEGDCTLGQYVEDICIGAANTCKKYNRKMLDHHRQYVHGYGQLSISAHRQPARMTGMSNIILMWSVCRKCQAETSVVPMSDNSWKYSFAKYLESSFWSRPLHPRAGVCEHDIHKDFVRCFGFQDLVVRVLYDPIDIYDIVVPHTSVSWRVEADLTVKNEQYQHFEVRLNSFIDSIKKRLGTINVDTLDEKQMMEAQDLIDSLRQRAEDDRKELLDKLQVKYSTSRYYELIPLNRALRFMDKKELSSWDEVFASFERDYFPSENDIRKLAAAQLKEMFYGSHSSTDSIALDNSDTEGGSELTTFPTNSQSQGLMGSEAPSEKTYDVLTSVAQEHRSQSDTATSHGPVKKSNAEMYESNTLLDSNAASTEDVKHLDLAIQDHPPEEVNHQIESMPALSPESSHSQQDGTHTRPLLSPPQPLSSGLVQRIEEIRKGTSGERSESDVSESKIPRLTDLKKREEGQPGPPAFSRAQSQPHIPKLGMEHGQLQVERSRQAGNGEPIPLERRFNDRLSRLGNKLGSIHPSLIPRSIPNKSENGSTNTVSALAKHFEHLSREFERERLRERRLRAAKSRQARANPLASSRPVVEVYTDATEAVGERRHENVAPSKTMPEQTTVVDHAQETTTDEPQPAEEPPSQPSRSSQSFEKDRQTDTEVDTDASDTELTTQSQGTADPISELSGSSLISPSAQDLEFNPELSIPEHKRNVWFKVLSEFWSKRSASGWSSLEYPLHINEHVFEDSDIIVREDEPSSIIALSLSSSDYINKAKDFRSSIGKASKNTAAEPVDLSDPVLQASIESSLLSDTGTHMKYSFSHGQVKASCKIFYAEAFDALRQRCGVTHRFVESLSRCMKFDSKGGKTKSLFLKTMDNRFIIKSLQEVEVKAFTRFAPDYFAFMSHTLFRGVPSVIAKMFGLFQVIIKNPASGIEFNYYLLVMENLFYDHAPNRRFDLKGSMRNRKIESTGQPDEVLLDENLVETIFESPLFVREQSRRLLQASVWNDTLWLCKQNVMDYSLMAGFEDDGHQLVVGIIDCIRTYTWDKRLETWMKDRGKNKPTITSPRDYRNRFRVSMMQYVLQAPSCWHQFQASMAPPKTLKEKEDTVAPDEVEAELVNRGIKA
ncbi:hypothetical protein AMS68_002616 [Peltaster fructicola]|uniref:1-phosphatidylinositol-3-phosphate 5-kinase n=1 Tax=Peltaster fructicola TaxID=286661 RepID=A0A6H0XR47_9PEZI|nr:hypothetical protein AMS68_002616 [Peltaster fructicola]